MTTEIKEGINVAPTSTEGHFVRKAKSVVNLDAINETFLVQGESELVTKNHTNLEMNEDCIITCQTIYDPFKEAFRKAED